MPMARSGRAPKVFVSSTSEDLRDYRAVARLAVLDMNWTPLMIEDLGVRSASSVSACYEHVDKADAAIFIVAFRQGWTPTIAQGGNGRESITALELARARARKMPVLVFLASEAWPGTLWETDAEKRAALDGFRAGLNMPVILFEPEARHQDEERRFPVFRSKVVSALAAFRERLLVEPIAAVPTIFVSYAHEDKHRIAQLCHVLEEQGWSVFWDRRIPTGEIWD